MSTLTLPHVWAITSAVVSPGRQVIGHAVAQTSVLSRTCAAFVHIKAQGSHIFYIGERKITEERSTGT